MFTKRRFGLLLLVLCAQIVTHVSAGTEFPRPATVKWPPGFRGRPNHIPIAVNQTSNNTAPNKPTNVQVPPLSSQGIVVLSWTDGNLTADNNTNESYQVVCSYDWKCNTTSTLGWSAPPVGRNITQNYATALPVDSTNYYCFVVVTNTNTNQTTCSDPILMTQPSKPTLVTSVDTTGDVWSASWQDGAGASPTETYSGKCVTLGSGCTGQSLGFSESYIPRGVSKTRVVGLPTDTLLDCFIIASNLVGSTCSEAQRVIVKNRPPQQCSNIVYTAPTNTALYTNRGSSVITQCNIVNNAFTSCSISTAANTGTGFLRPRGMARYGSSTLFIANSGATNIMQCTLSGGTISSCFLPTPTGGFNFPHNPIDLVIIDNFMYITMEDSLSICTLSGGTITSCSNPPAPPTGWLLSNAYGIVNLGNILYISDKINNYIVQCTISSPGVISGCKVPSVPNWNFNGPGFMLLSGCTLFIGNDPGFPPLSVTQCTLNPYTLDVANCFIPTPPTGQLTDTARGMGMIGITLYIANQFGVNEPITQCTLSSGVISSCAYLGLNSVIKTVFDEPMGALFKNL